VCSSPLDLHVLVVTFTLLVRSFGVSRLWKYRVYFTLKMDNMLYNLVFIRKVSFCFLPSCGVVFMRTFSICYMKCHILCIILMK